MSDFSHRYYLFKLNKFNCFQVLYHWTLTDETHAVVNLPPRPSSSSPPERWGKYHLSWGTHFSTTLRESSPLPPSCLTSPQFRSGSIHRIRFSTLFSEHSNKDTSNMLWEICQHGYNTASNLSNVTSPPKKVGRQTCFKTYIKNSYKMLKLDLCIYSFWWAEWPESRWGGGVAVDHVSV